MKYEFEAEVWIWQGEKAAWRFVTLPPELTAGIKSLRGPARGWGGMTVKATIGGTTWRSMIVPNSKSDCFMLPLKAAVRKAEGVEAGDRVKAVVELLI